MVFNQFIACHMYKIQLIMGYDPAPSTDSQATKTLKRMFDPDIPDVLTKRFLMAVCRAIGSDF